MAQFVLILMQEELFKKQLKPMNPEERAAEKQRIQREQEEADLALAMEAFGRPFPLFIAMGFLVGLRRNRCNYFVFQNRH